MNALAKIDDTPRAELIKVLQDSIWIGAKPQSVEMALSYCRVNGLDPFLKPIHIVPIWDKNSGGMRDTIMPGIADYRIKAARSNEYAGITEPEFGPMITSTWGNVACSHPEWCKVTVYRIVGGAPRAFTAREEWLENYAIAGGKEKLQHPNAMWTKRPKGQLAKCTEAQALRKAFPEFSGGMPTAEEMEGKTFEGQTIDAEPIGRAAPELAKAAPAAPAGPSEKTRQTCEALINKIASCEDPQEWMDSDTKSANYRAKLAQAHPDLARDVEDAFEAARDRLFPEADATLDAMSDIPSDELPDFDMERAVAIASLMETAATRKELDGIKNQGDNAKWLKSVEARLDIKTLLVKSYEDAAARLGAA